MSPFKYPVKSKCTMFALWILLQLASTYLGEGGFSMLLSLKTKMINTLYVDVCSNENKHECWSLLMSYSFNNCIKYVEKYKLYRMILHRNNVYLMCFLLPY